jgi:hypothetical protein
MTARHAILHFAITCAASVVAAMIVAELFARKEGTLLPQPVAPGQAEV